MQRFGVLGFYGPFLIETLLYYIKAAILRWVERPRYKAEQVQWIEHWIETVRKKHKSIQKNNSIILRFQTTFEIVASDFLWVYVSTVTKAASWDRVNGLSLPSISAANFLT